MKKIIVIILILIISLVIFGDFVRKSENKKVSDILLKNKFTNKKVWILFTDKGIYSEKEMYDYLDKHKNIVSERSIERRIIRANNVYSFEDIPVKRDYIKTLKTMNINIVHKSKWLNGVSAYINSEDLSKLEKLDFIYKIIPVAQAKKDFDLKKVDYKTTKADTTDSIINKYDYGVACKPQIEQIGVNLLHNMGYTGDGVLIAIFDTGFKIKEEDGQVIPYHDALQNVKIINTYSFLKDTSYVGMTTSLDIDQVDHGTKMLALMGAYRYNNLISPAFGANYILAETEDVNSETPSEEDNWIAAAEWADSLGADIISSSVGYKDWYSYTMMTGDSCAITIAADIAASKGIIVVNAIGNVEDENALRDTCIIAPADADSIITVGGVDDYNVLSAISALGPTYDKFINPSLDTLRIKPDILGLAEFPWTINTADDSSYLFVSGTSGATALIAGGCALILQAHPDWTADKVREALKHTATVPLVDPTDTSNYWTNIPNDSIGWGIANFYNAVMYGDTDELFYLDKDELSSPYPNPFSIANHGRLRIPFKLSSKVTLLDLYIYTLDGKLVYHDERKNLLPGVYTGEDSFIWYGTNMNGSIIAQGTYIIMLDSHFEKSIKKIQVVH